MSHIYINVDRFRPYEGPFGFRPFKAGDIISGKVIVQLEKPLWVRQVKISFMGQAGVRWREYRKDGRLVDDEGDHYSDSNDEEIFVMKTIRLWPTDDGGPTRTRTPYLKMPAGKHEFKFSLPIPKKTRLGFPLPGTVVAQRAGPEMFFGSADISYYLVARAVRPMFCSELTSLRPDIQPNYLDMMEFYDLNTDPRASKPIAVTAGKTIRSWFCCPGRIDVSIKLPKTGYAIGEFLGVSTEIVNRSSRTIKEVRLQLIQICEFRTRNPRNSHLPGNYIIASVIIKNLVLPCQTKHWENEGFLISKGEYWAPTKVSMEACRIFEYRHQLDVDVFLKGSSSPIEIHHIPLIIGTVPLTTPAPDPRSKCEISSENHASKEK